MLRLKWGPEGQGGLQVDLTANYIQLVNPFKGWGSQVWQSGFRSFPHPFNRKWEEKEACMSDGI